MPFKVFCTFVVMFFLPITYLAYMFMKKFNFLRLSSPGFGSAMACLLDPDPDHH
jgi:hypothetical protein